MSYRDNYKLIDWSRPIRIERKAQIPPARSALPFPMIITDQMDETEHPCDGRQYTSKRAFRKVTRENGCIEVGNDPQRFKTPKKPRRDMAAIDRSIDRAVARLKSA